MKINGTEIGIGLRDLFLLLRALSEPGPGEIDLALLRKHSPSMSDQRTLARIHLLAEQLNIPEGEEARVALEFAKIVGDAEDESGLPRARLLKAFSVFTPRPAPAATFLKKYEEKACALLARSAGNFTRDGDAKGLRLDTRPLTRQWPREIVESPAWNSIESPVPGVPDLPLEDIWVDLTLNELDTFGARHARALEAEAWNELSFDRDWVGVSLRKALSRVYGLTVVVGLPGAGKSTLTKWVARHLVTDPDCPFGIPLVISLRQYAKERGRRSGLRLFEYFLNSRGVTDATQLRLWRELADGLSDTSEGTSAPAETFLWLLDGWDEVPHEMRAAVLPEIQSLALHPCIVTTRHSGDPLRLPAQQYYEIQGLKHGAALDFAHRWLVKTGKGAYYAGVEVRLEESADLRRMARSPFLLTLICALAANPTGNVRGGIPPRRGGVLRETLRLVFEQHNADPKQDVKFKGRDREDVSRFAFWLLAHAPGAPRYVFDGHDYERAVSRKGRFDSLLAPSRLVARPTVGSTDFQFLHASFQEYLAAHNLLLAPDDIPKGGTLLFNPVWKEVARFLAEEAAPDADAWPVLWREARASARRLDRFGIIASRLSLLVAAAGERDGGRRLLGVDLREHLWRVMTRYAAQGPTPLLEAFVELDSTDFARRILDHRIRTGKNSLRVSWLAQVSVFDIESLAEQKKYQKVLAHPEVAAFCPDVQPLWEGPDAYDAEDMALLEGVKKAISSRDIAAMKAAVWQMIREGMVDAAAEAIHLLLKLPTGEAGELLLEIAVSDEADVLSRGKAVSCLVMLNDRDFRNRLMAYVASLEMDDPALPPILGNLDGYALTRREAELVLDLLRHARDSYTRYAAAELLTNARARRGVAASMTAAITAEPDEEVKVAILETLAELADESAVAELWRLREGEALKSDKEWEQWFKAVLVTLEESRRRVAALGGAPPSDPLTAAVRELASLAASSEGGEHLKLAYPVFKAPAILGKTAARHLIAAARNERLPEMIRAAALEGLSHFGGRQVIQFLSGFARAGKKPASDLLRQTACDSLGTVSPEALSKLRTKHARVATARLAFRYQMLFMARGGSPGVMSKQTSEVAHVMPEPDEKVIKILLLGANPSRTLRLDEEERAIKQKVRESEYRGLIDIQTAPAVRPTDLIPAMNRFEPHVVQFSGHGNSGQGIIVSDNNRKPHPIGAGALKALFESTEKNVQVVVLNACYTRPQAEAIASVVPCVIGMTDAIRDKAARLFAGAFYGALGYGLSVQKAFDQGIAELRLAGVEDQAHIPVLITRTDVKASEIFLVNPTAPTPR